MGTDRAHPYGPAASFDGGDLDCGNGLLLLIRKHIDPLADGQLLEIRSSERSVCEDLPAWCRLTGNELVSRIEVEDGFSFLVSKRAFVAPSSATPGEGAVEKGTPDGEPSPSPEPRRARVQAPITQAIVPVVVPDELPEPSPAPSLAPLSVVAIGSWPRPRWMLRALHEHLEGRMSEQELQETADDAVRLVVDAQLRAGVDILTDGEQRRDNYASFVGGRLDNCQLVPITDLLPYVDDPAKFEAELRALDVPASEVRHPAVFGPLGRRRPLAVHELQFVRSLSDKPVKVALPGPYLLTRTMWMECISDRAYDSREHLARDVVRVLREEVCFLLAAGATLVQLDEPVLSEVVFGAPSGGRTFMCGALGEKRGQEEELAFACELIDEVLVGLPRERLALHVCRGNWSPDERVALAGDYRPLLPLLSQIPVGTLLLEMCTPRAGEVDILRALPRDLRLGLGVVNQKDQAVDTVDAIVERAERAITSLGAERLLLTTDCGFATFADNPIVSARVAEAKLAAMTAASAILRARHGIDGAAARPSG